MLGDTFLHTMRLIAQYIATTHLLHERGVYQNTHTVHILVNGTRL